MSDDFADSLAHMSEVEIRTLVVALVRQLGGRAVISEEDAARADAARPLVQIVRHEYPQLFTVHLHETVSGDVQHEGPLCSTCGDMAQSYTPILVEEAGAFRLWPCGHEVETLRWRTAW
jgi:hypothetical protein